VLGKVFSKLLALALKPVLLLYTYGTPGMRAFLTFDGNTQLCKVLTVLAYSPIGVKFPPNITQRTRYTVKKKLTIF
jgi:hypothetical protein